MRFVVSRESLLRGAAVAVITASITLAAACSDEDLVDTIPPPRPNPTRSTEGPVVGPPSSTGAATTSSTTASTSTPPP